MKATKSLPPPLHFDHVLSVPHALRSAALSAIVRAQAGSRSSGCIINARYRRRFLELLERGADLETIAMACGEPRNRIAALLAMIATAPAGALDVLEG